MEIVPLPGDVDKLPEVCAMVLEKPEIELELSLLEIAEDRVELATTDELEEVAGRMIT